jgi:5-methylcytosine-specific restriction endonuclease McrA
MSFTTFDNITRSALWNSYNNICFYCTQPLEWDDLNIDHIVPELYSKDIGAFEKVKAEYELDKAFDLNALYNLVPTHSKCNRRKSGELFKKQATLFFLGLTGANQIVAQK